VNRFNLLGTPTEPLLVLESTPVQPGDEDISIDEARADWSNVTLAAGGGCHEPTCLGRNISCLACVDRRR
jgi:hypothetical protein